LNKKKIIDGKYFNRFAGILLIILGTVKDNSPYSQKKIISSTYSQEGV
jgi:hypothetical protein